MFTITEVYNNIPCREGLTADWGFSCQIAEAALLFDTGAKRDVLVSNMKALGINPGKLRYLVLSHDHWDHIGGIEAVLAENPSVEVYVHDAFSEKTLSLIREHTEPRIVREWTEIADGIAVTGPLGTDIREQSLAVAVSGGYLVVTGCAHPHIARIVARVSEVGPVLGVIGGFHSVSGEDIEALAGVAYLSASHCTDKIAELKECYPGSFQPGGVGKVHRF
ncbi:MBL fold metallo-hydrolase [Methanoculleus sp. FWC-SCC3]|uniref:MBL fold metallo-hydrolase n=1 Tax=Methanoculleus methanifontis TaxID=2584086 RepID=A0ABT8M410_9EURY|nr:MBL fold metallo-hydrolase [Methanoculleus sp. FWC-SCC3]MDN7013367.1 MBL fold metallo-hydrolase [Methanoculleus sp. FWC-SCC3]